MSTIHPLESQSPRSFRTPWFWGIAAALAAAVTFGGAQPAHGHDYLTSASPADGATVQSRLDVVSLTFSEAPLEGLGTSSYISVVAADGRTASGDEVTIDGPTLSVPVTFGNPGIYTVTWQTVSSDGHPISGDYSFTWLSNGASESSQPSATSVPTPSVTEQSSTPAPPSEAEKSGSADVVIFWAVALALIVALGVTAYIVVARRRRARGPEEAP
jgi:methionine-rich copper-binding protein CopC